MGFQRKKLQILEEMQGEWKERKVFYTDPSIPIMGAVLKSWSPGSHLCCSDKAECKADAAVGMELPAARALYRCFGSQIVFTSEHRAEPLG